MLAPCPLPHFDPSLPRAPLNAGRAQSGAPPRRGPRWAALRWAAPLAALAAGLRRFSRRSLRGGLRAVPLAELLGPNFAWPELEVEGFRVVAADLGDLDRAMAIVAPVFEVNLEDAAEAESVRKGIAGRLGALRSLVGLDAANPRPRLTRPRPRGSVEVPELGLVLALEAGAAERPAFVALVDLSLWPSDGRVRAPGARSKPGVASAPYVLNLCVEPSWRRRGLARKLMAVLERLVRDVEDEQGAANCLYENLNYVPMKYTPRVAF
ncbi:unnamed protein product [Effrenium voratum]|nr:unnamed protein product [Effrenium voratum]